MDGSDIHALATSVAASDVAQKRSGELTQPIGNTKSMQINGSRSEVKEGTT